eukprot:SAG11_NODE_8252_length_1040_cov_1.263549_1_plen_124_part_10
MYEKLRRAKYISTLDLKNGYWNAGLDEESRPLTAFATEFGLYEYNVVPQGLVCSAAFFQHWVEAKLRRHGVLFEHMSVEGQNPDTMDSKDDGSDRVHDNLGRYKGTDPIAVGKLKGERGFVAVY